MLEVVQSGLRKMRSQTRRSATRRMHATAGLVDAEQLPKLLVGRDSFLREFASPEKISLEFLAKLGVLPLFVGFGLAAASGWWLVIFTSHGSAPFVHKKRGVRERPAHHVPLT